MIMPFSTSLSASEEELDSWHTAENESMEFCSVVCKGICFGDGRLIVDGLIVCNDVVALSSLLSILPFGVNGSESICVHFSGTE